MTSSGCLNCATPIAEKYCPNCGQKSTTHRYSIVNFVEHDFIHGVWHVDKGIFFTIKELFSRPGHSIREYIQGKRANYFSFVTLILLILTLSSLLAPYVHIKMFDLIASNRTKEMNSFEAFISKYPKLIILILIPVNSFFSFIWFKRAKLNFSEHLVANSYKAAVELIIGLIFTVILIFYTNIQGLSVIYTMVVMPLIFLYGLWYYYQLFFCYGYSKKARFFRSLAAIVTAGVFQFVIGMVWVIVQMKLMK